MNHLIVYAHPHKGSFNNAILDTAVAALKAKGHEICVRDLYKLNFHPVLSATDTAALREGRAPADIKQEQEHLAEADVITFIYPIWWTGLPAILKGYVDRTFSYGFAYQYNSEGGIDKLFTGKKGVIINTYGTPGDVYEATGMNEALKKTSGGGIFDFCGVEVVEHFLFGGVTTVATDETRKEMLARIHDKFSSF
ncbi:NAD(P)H-dependent oxidoreductase [Paenibacillus mucilaginosus]|uniref:NAD(P)H dehydrogenase (Quinone) n=1 Tax=Paenibacillus mucilaginosus (strain KNP414) TaxID=1036673 RepID=F8FI33_PAEMK|nr:NAD(P)H-dependent oxidoreductase [Paenibacillus mucilaginosus]AEI43375.1 NAD(P)H dehydrogenase (quinone) [Paenibacillus mucilaginosus KNP414]MCG7212076.1 NAD(P)H-dependent oxidoreductase [Paenibacillus mucilaginosus]WDM24940.1 NAD(P)H-dependent oxidoreductase [Paenibacillus mucilaginosus]